MPKGKLPVGDEVIWIEEWRDRLKEELGTDTFRKEKHQALVRELVHEIDTMGKFGGRDVLAK